MARIHITAEPIGARDGAVVLDERIRVSDLDSGHFAAALIERIGWALVDAEGAERNRNV